MCFVCFDCHICSLITKKKSTLIAINWKFVFSTKICWLVSLEGLLVRKSFATYTFRPGFLKKREKFWSNNDNFTNLFVTSEKNWECTDSSIEERITTTWIQISRQNRNGIFSNISHQIMHDLTNFNSFYIKNQAHINAKNIRNWL